MQEVFSGNCDHYIQSPDPGLSCDDDTSTIEVVPPTCTVDLQPPTAEIELGASRNFFANVVPGSLYNISDVSRVNFGLNPGGIATVNPAFDTTSPYSTVVRGDNIGSTTLRSDVIMYGFTPCFDTSDIEVVNPPGWWQVKEGDAIAAVGDITTDIPFACVSSPACTEAFILNDPGDEPGVPSFTGSISMGTDGGYISSKNWSVQSPYLDPTSYTYGFFENKLPVSPAPIAGPWVSGGVFSAGGANVPV